MMLHLMNFSEILYILRRPISLSRLLETTKLLVNSPASIIIIMITSMIHIITTMTWIGHKLISLMHVIYHGAVRAATHDATFHRRHIKVDGERQLRPNVRVIYGRPSVT